MTRLPSAGPVVCRTAAALAAVLVLTALRPAPLRAQSDLRRADSLLRAGRVASAESVYYRVVRRRPRDPAGRLALGRYLAARGATKVGAVLIEEARFFGLSPAMAAVHLGPLYAQLNEWQTLASLDLAILSAGERQRARWLASNAPSVQGPDSATLAYVAPRSVAPHELGTLGAVVLRLGRDSILAEIDPTVRGVVLDRSRGESRGVRLFTGGATDDRQTVGVVPRAQLGAFTLINLPVSFGQLGGASHARIGLDFLARFAPTFDPQGRRVLLRRTGRIGRTAAGRRLPLLMEVQGTWVARNGRLENLASSGLTRELARGPWTLDGRRGELVMPADEN